MNHTGIWLIFGSAAGFVDQLIQFLSPRESSGLLRSSRLDDPVIVEDEPPEKGPIRFAA